MPKRPTCAEWYHRWTVRFLGWNMRPAHVCTRCGKTEPIDRRKPHSEQALEDSK